MSKYIMALLVAAMVQGICQAQTSTTRTTTSSQRQSSSQTTTTYKPNPGKPAPIERHTVTRWHYHKGYRRASDPPVGPIEKERPTDKMGTTTGARK